METSESIAALAAALSKAQSVMEGAKKDADNPFFKSKYADLASVWEACRKPLTDNQLCIIQSTSSDENGITLDTILAHSSGEWIKGTLSIPTSKKDPQTYGSVMSYARRYALQAMVGLTSIDDDAEENMQRQPEKPKPHGKQPEPRTQGDPAQMSEAQRKKLWAMMKNDGLDNDMAKDFFAFVNPKTATAASQFIENFDTLKGDWEEARSMA